VTLISEGLREVAYPLYARAGAGGEWRVLGEYTHEAARDFLASPSHDYVAWDVWRYKDHFTVALPTGRTCLLIGLQPPQRHPRLRDVDMLGMHRAWPGYWESASVCSKLRLAREWGVSFKLRWRAAVALVNLVVSANAGLPLVLRDAAEALKSFPGGPEEDPVRFAAKRKEFAARTSDAPRLRDTPGWVLESLEVLYCEGYESAAEDAAARVLCANNAAPDPLPLSVLHGRVAAHLPLGLALYAACYGSYGFIPREIRV